MEGGGMGKHWKTGNRNVASARGTYMKTVKEVKVSGGRDRWRVTWPGKVANACTFD